MLWIVHLVMLGLLVVVLLVLYKLKPKPSHGHSIDVEPGEGLLVDPPPSPAALSKEYLGQAVRRAHADNA